MRTIGVLTGGGDCPGLNATIRAVVKRSSAHGWDVIGIRDGWKGLIESHVEPLTDYSVTGILPKGGTILGSSRTNPFKRTEDVQKMMDNIKKFGIDGIIAIGGEDTLGVACRVWQRGVHIVGIPKTIDNDLGGTDQTFGFDTAVTIATEAIDRLHSTAESHHRIMVIEVMGRHAGWIATMSGIAGGADEILIPEKPFDMELVCKGLKKRYDRGKSFSIVVVAEGAKPKKSGSLTIQSDKVDAFGHVRLGGIGYTVAQEIEKRLGVETRVTVLGHIQRGGSPTAYDRVLATRFGYSAVELMNQEDYGKMVALQGNDIIAINIEDAVSKLRTVDMQLYEVAKSFFGSGNTK